MPSHITRRDAAVRLVTQSALLLAIPLPLFGQADQEGEPREDDRMREDDTVREDGRLREAPRLREAINTAINQGESLRAEVVAGSVPTTPWIDGVIRRELDHRRVLAHAFDAAPPPNEAVYVHDGFMPAYEFVVGADARPIPTPERIERSRITIECRDLHDANEPVSRILADILFKALGVTVDVDLFRQFLEQDPDLQMLFESWTNAISTQNWHDVAKLIDAFLGWLIIGGGALRLISFFRDTNALSQGFRHTLGWTISVRFVPFVGWAYLAASILLAIKANFHRFSGNDRDRGC